MYPPPPDSVVEQIRGSVLGVITFGKYTISLRFENGVRICVEAPYRFGTRRTLDDTAIIEFPLLSTDLVRLLGESVAAAKCEADGTLELQFANDDVLVVYATNPKYEAYSLVIDGKLFIV